MMRIESVQGTTITQAKFHKGLIALAAWIGLGVFAGRSILIFATDHLAHGIGLQSSLWRLSRSMPGNLGLSLLVGVTASFLAVLGQASRGDESKRAQPVVRRALAWMAVWALFVCAVSGIGFDQSERVPGTDTQSGILVWALLLIGGMVGATVTLLAANRRKLGELSLLSGRPFSILLPLCLSALCLVLVRFVSDHHVASMEVRTIARALLEGQPTWELLKSHPTAAPSVGVIVPVVDWRVGGGERPALIMPPGSEVRLRVTKDDGPVVLRSEVGVDQSVLTKLKPAWKSLTFGFQVALNGEVVFDEELSLSAGMEPTENFWHPVGGSNGLALKPGDVVELRTRVIETQANSPIIAHAFRIGFSKLILERTWASERTTSSPQNPNLILLLQDTQRSDRLGCYGYEKNTTPNLDRLADRGTLYEQAYAASSWTWPSTTSILCGKLSQSHGVLTGASCYLSSAIEIVPEALQRGGFTTIAVSGSPLIVPAKNFDQGFETFYGNASSFRTSDLLIPSALDWIRMNAGTRFFMYLHLVDTHDPHMPRAEAREQFVGQKPRDLEAGAFGEYTWELRKNSARTENGEWDATRVAPLSHQKYLSDVYDACVATGDYWVGQVLDTVAELGLSDETVFVYTSDHGEEFFDHGKLEHSHSLFGELVRVPLILAGPNIPSGLRIDEPISNRHIAATLAALGGVRIEGLRDGQNLAQPARLKSAPVYFSTYLGWWNNWYRTPLHGVRDGDWVLHLAPEAGDWGSKISTPGGQRRLYNVSGGRIVEGAPVENDQQSQALEQELRAKLKTLETEHSQTSIQSGEGTRSLLEGIGYIEGAEED